ncbi:MAG: hypothetical protein IJ689_07855 [Alphaproteobacteria bacterium]|nr:hypothetical protein [Alphaproteobacteria bacterium]MBR1649489.1 hypothetical protein [Alphaproteobacteria bacterium]
MPKSVVDFKAEKEDLQKELDVLIKNLEGNAKKLNNPAFIDKSPAAVITEERRHQAGTLENKTKVGLTLKRANNL